jgi:hypothetical protein
MKLIARLALAGVILLGALVVAFTLYAATVNVRTSTVRSTDGTHDTGWPLGDKPVVLPNRIKFQPGWYALYNRTCVPEANAPGHGCHTSDIVSTINTEICPNSGLVGMKLLTYPTFLFPNTAGNYTGSADQGFTAIDAILAALRNCGKYLILQSIYGEFGGPDAMYIFFPTYTFSPSPCPQPFYDCTQGTAATTSYGVVANTQSSQPGSMAKLWNDDWRDLAIAAATAYCARYDSNPAFYAIGMLYWNTSMPIDPTVPPAGYTEAGFNTQYRTYLDAVRAACPTTNVLATLDYANPNPAQMSTHLAKLQSMHGSVANNDTWISRGATWGQQVYTAETGSPSLIDYRGNTRYMEEVESPDMCGSRQTASPAQIFAVMQNGNSVNRARWPNTIVIAMATECDDQSGTGWVAWKNFIASISGQIMDARGPTLRTPTYVKANACESSMTCQ